MIAAGGAPPTTWPAVVRRRSTSPARSGSCRCSASASPRRTSTSRCSRRGWRRGSPTRSTASISKRPRQRSKRSTHLAAVDIELLTPERLTRRTATHQGRRPAEGRCREPDDSAPRRSSTGPWSSTTLPSTRQLLERAAASGAGLININGRWVRLDRTEARRALANLAEHRRDHAELSTLELLRLAAELAATEETRPSSAPLDATVRRSTTTARRSPRPVGSAICCRASPTPRLAEGVEPPGFMATLRPYQRRGLGWLQFLHQLGLGGCLADDMGLGKTPTTLAHLSALPGPHLVICPLSVVRNWEAEAARFTPLLRVAVHHGTGRSGAAAFANIVAQHDLVITTYHVAARDIETLQARAVDDRRASTRPKRSRTPRPAPPRRCARCPPRSTSRSPAHRSRTGSASCGRSCRWSRRDCSAASPSSADASPRPSNATTTSPRPRHSAG